MYNYYVIEIQTNADGTSGNFVFGFAARQDADEKFGTLYAAAAKSSVMIHSIALMTNRCEVIENKAFVHPVEPEQ